MDYITAAKIIFPAALLIGGLVPILMYGKYDVIHRHMVQIVALLVALPGVIFCLGVGILDAGVGGAPIGTIVGYAFGVGSAK